MKKEDEMEVVKMGRREGEKEEEEEKEEKEGFCKVEGGVASAALRMCAVGRGRHF